MDTIEFALNARRNTKVCVKHGTTRCWLVLLLSMYSLLAVEAQADGPLRVHPDNPRYFTDNTGRAILLAGSHTWTNLVDFGPSDPPAEFDFDAYLTWLESHGHNFTRGWTWEPTRWDTTKMKSRAWRNANHFVAPHPWARTGPGTALDGKPKFDLTTMNQPYLDRLRTRVEKAGSRGIYMSIMLFEGYGVQFQKEAWANHPFNPANNINGIDGDTNGDGKGIEIHQMIDPNVTAIQEAYVRELVRTLNECDNVLYEISNETHPASTQWQYHMIRFIKDVEKDMPKQHPVGMTYQNNHGKNQALFDSPADWISPNKEGGFRDDPPDMEGVKVVLSDTDHLWGIGGDAAWVWKSVTRGLNPILMDTYDGKVLGRPFPRALESPRRSLGKAIEYTSRMDLARAKPSNSLSSTGFCLADPGVTYLVYVPGDDVIELDLSDGQGPYTVEWWDPLTAETLVESAVLSGNSKRELDVPFDREVVLFVKLTDSTSDVIHNSSESE